MAFLHQIGVLVIGFCRLICDGIGLLFILNINVKGDFSTVKHKIILNVYELIKLIIATFNLYMNKKFISLIIVLGVPICTFFRLLIVLCC